MSLAEANDNRADRTLAEDMRAMGKRARAAAEALANASTEAKNAALLAMAAHIRGNVPALIDANARDIQAARTGNKPAAFIDRLTLDPARIEAIAATLEATAALPDPVGEITESWTRPNGLNISRVRTPIGVIGIIYEARPNVTADAGALSMKSGNAAILRSGSDSINSAQVIAQALRAGLGDAGLPEDAIQIVTSTERAAVGMMLQGLDGAIDLIVPRGGKSLVARVQADARVPVFAHLEGICHVYIDKAADTAMAIDIALNAKMRRPGICGAAECILFDAAGGDAHLKPVVAALLDAGCEVRGDETVRAACPGAKPASAEDWGCEFLDAIVAARVVEGLDGAIAHIRQYGSHHTDCIVSGDDAAASRFLNELDSAIVMHNASTQFADGGEFGFGAEIGIATGKLHARGPVGLEQLTSFKYQVRGTGQTRP